jgi:ectoine hydroxylase-related dioxygenase (phytanoyl-CoA dioxygenase family)
MDFPRVPSEPFHVVTALWLLDDFTPDNGATQVVPGSHRLAKGSPRPMQQPESRHPDQKLVLAEAGSVLVFNGHLWHGGTRNESARPRRALQGQFRAREMVPATRVSRFSRSCCPVRIDGRRGQGPGQGENRQGGPDSA